jgi:predicted MPP superfamily phosphohydrolase
MPRVPGGTYISTVATTGALIPALALLGAVGYSLFEPYRYRLREVEVPLPRGPDLTVLHVSDLHMRTGDDPLRRFLASIPGRLRATPDIVVATGDLIATNEGIGPVVDALGGLQARLGRFYVLGSHDYYVSRFGSYLKYFSRDRRPVAAPRARTAELERGLRAAGWRALTNETASLSAGAEGVRITGVDDPYLGRHRTEHIRRKSSDDLAIGVVHTPDVVSEWALAGYDLVLAGHTHGGQVRFPFVGAVVTNCSLPSALASGLHRIGGTWLHVSPGLGTGRFSPIRFNCRPEATLLRVR